jgi:hypothetical protein
MLVPPPARNQINPEVIVDNTEGQPRNQIISGRKRKRKDKPDRIDGRMRGSLTTQC